MIYIQVWNPLKLVVINFEYYKDDSYDYQLIFVFILREFFNQKLTDLWALLYCIMITSIISKNRVYGKGIISHQINVKDYFIV